MRLPWRTSPQPMPLWAVRLAFFGARIELPGGSVEAGCATQYVRARDAAEARRTAVENAKRALVELKPLPPVPSVFWSIESIEPAAEVGNSDFEFHARAKSLEPPPLRSLLEELTDEDLRLSVGTLGFGVIAERPEETTVAIEFEELEYFVEAEFWHGHFKDPEEAINVFRWLLTPFYRIGTERQNGELAVAWIERYDGETWEALDPILFRNPSDPTQWMGGNWTREYRQQSLRALPVPFEEIVPDAQLDRRGYPAGTVLGVTELPFNQSLAEEVGWLEEEYRFDPGMFDPPAGLE